SDRTLSTVAPAEHAARVDRDGPEDLGPRAGELVSHRAAIAEPHRINLGRVDAQIALDELDQIIGELKVLAARVAPAVADALRSHEDGRVAGLGLHPVVRPDVAAGPTA